MKLIIAVISIILLSNPILSQSELVVFSNEGNQFYIILNGIKQNGDPQTNVKIENIKNTNYKLKIIFADGTTPDIDKGIFFETDQQYVAEIRKNKKGVYKLRYVSATPLQQATYESPNTISYTNTNAVSTQNSGATVSTTTITTTNSSTTTTINNSLNEPNNGQSENIDMSINSAGVEMNVNLNINEQGSTTTHSTTETTITETSEQTSTSNSNSVNCYYSDIEMDALIKEVKNESFSDEQKMIAKQALKNKCISTEQVIELMSLFSFDDDKLEIAIYCYDRCSDKDNYFKVNSSFSFSDSKQKLNQYIEGK